ncbi:MAG: hypothetical protein JWO94_626 [Verrucomicrobiaceae bacterium]|nr:hypothetical protein [Verrucomicrobiaceae bacterium]
MSNKTIIAGAALAGIFAGSYSAVAASAKAPADAGSSIIKMADKDTHTCKGKNACKGQGGCKSGDNGCKGKNSCKGKGGCNPKMK